MGFTDENFSRFNGGQFEVRNTHLRLVFRGGIETARMVKRGDLVTLNIVPEWMAQGVGYPTPTGWRATVNIIYKANPLLYTASRIDNGRVQLQSEVTGETTVLYPPGQIVLDRSQVEGL